MAWHIAGLPVRLFVRHAPLDSMLFVKQAITISRSATVLRLDRKGVSRDFPARLPSNIFAERFGLNNEKNRRRGRMGHWVPIDMYIPIYEFYFIFSM